MTNEVQIDFPAGESQLNVCLPQSQMDEGLILSNCNNSCVINSADNGVFLFLFFFFHLLNV